MLRLCGQRDGGPAFDRRTVPLIIIGVVIALCCGCNTSARAQPIPTVPPQPTLNKTMDAVVRGLIPTATHPTTTRSPLDVSPLATSTPAPRLPALTEAPIRPAAATSPPATHTTAVAATPTVRQVPTETHPPAVLLSPTAAIAHSPTTVPMTPTRATAGARSDEPVGAVRAPPTLTPVR